MVSRESSFVELVELWSDSPILAWPTSRLPLREPL
jgi:hypothetical protein